MRFYYGTNPDPRDDNEKLDAFVRGAWRLTFWVAGLLTVGGLADLLGLLN